LYEQKKFKLSTIAVVASCLILIAAVFVFVPFQKVKASAFDPFEASIKAKQDLVAKTRHNYKKLSAQEIVQQKERYDEIIADQTLDAKTRETKLNEIGYYTYRQGQEPSIGQKSSQDNVSLSSVTIRYNSVLDQWILSGYGNWKSGDYFDSGDGMNAINIDVGAQFNVGGADAVGILLMETYGSTEGLGVVDGLGTLTTGDHRYDVTTSNRTWLNSSQGAIYEMQDKILITQVDYFLGLAVGWRFNYIGASFEATVTYNGAFANYSGYARVGYTHTWNKTSITSIGIGKEGIDASWTNSSYGWKISSGTDTIF